MINSVIALAVAVFFPVVGYIILVVWLPAFLFSKRLFKPMKLKDTGHKRVVIDDVVNAAFFLA